MNNKESRRRLYREVVSTGWRKNAPPSVEGIEETDARRLLDDFYNKRVDFNQIPASPRLVNHFALGADPEMGFFDEHTGDYLHATNCGLYAGTAFGADNNGRLVEFRPQASRFALDVVASLLSELRWLYVTNRSARGCMWSASPTWGDDGLGGHVHFGRKQNTRVHEVAALDLVYNMLNGTVYSREAVTRRMRAGYGKAGDVRPQNHGYEYRSWPTWMSNPWSSYFHLVVAKLVTFDPELIGKRCTPETIQNLFAYYRNRDDDAAIAELALNRYGLPKETKVVQRGWGIPYDVNDVPKISAPVTLFPSCIEPDFNDKQAIFNYLVKGIPVPWLAPTPYWAPLNPPKNFGHMLFHVGTVQQPGFGELFNNVLHHENRPMRVVRFRNSGFCVHPLYKAAAPLIKNAFPFLPVNVTSDYGDLAINPQSLGTGVRKMRSIVLSGVFPLWDSKVASEATYQEWLDGKKPGFKSNSLRGRVLEVA